MACTDSSLLAIMSIVKNIVKLIQIIGPILAIVSLSLNFIHLMKSPENKKILPKVRNSLIALAVLFFVPMFVDVLFKMLGSSTNFSSCWNDANFSFSTEATYQPIETTSSTGILIDPSDYQHGTPKPSPSSSAPAPGATTAPFDDSKYSQYQTIATCDSSTMKYRIIKVNNAQIAIIWVQNPLMQMNGALASANSKGRASAEQILSNEISAMGLQSKCMVAVNASFFSYSTGSPVGGVVLNKGNIVKNEGNASGCVGIDSSNKLVECSHKSANDIASQGIRNTFVISSPAGHDNSGATASRTQVCQIDTNNFVLYSGSGTVGGCANVTQQVTGCSYSYNLDGGGSRKLYYKTQSSGSPIKVFGGDRAIPDMLYFAES